jgi:hypothetical protein
MYLLLAAKAGLRKRRIAARAQIAQKRTINLAKTVCQTQPRQIGEIWLQAITLFAIFPFFAAILLRHNCPRPQNGSVVARVKARGKIPTERYANDTDS